MVTLSKRKHRRNKLSRIFYVFMCFVLVIGLSAPTSAIGDSDSQNAATPTNQTTNASTNQPSTPTEVPAAKSTFKTSALQLYSDSALTDVLNAGDTVTSGQDIYGKFTYTFANAPQKNTWYTLTFDGNVDSVSAIGTSQITVNGQKAGEYRFDGTTVSFKYDSDWLDAHANGAGASGELEFKIALSDGAEAGGTVPVGISGVADDINLTEAVPETQADETQAETTSVDANTLATENALPADQLMASAAASNDEATPLSASSNDANIVPVTSDMLESSNLTLYKDANMTDAFEDGYTITGNQPIYGHLTYTFKNSSAPQENTWYTFTINTSNISSITPSASPISGTTHYPITDQGSTVGEWYIGGENNNIIYFQFNSDWLATHSSNVSGMFNFQMNVSPGGPTPGATIPVSIQDITNAITLTRQQVYSSSRKTVDNNHDGSYTFRISVTSDGSMNDIRLDDYLTNQFEFVPGTFELTKTDDPSFSYRPSVSTETPADSTYTHATVNVRNTLSSGTYTLTYNAKLTDDALKTIYDNVNSSGYSHTWTTTVDNLTATNIAQWHIGDLALDPQTCNVIVYQSALQKAYTGISNNEVSWKVDVNNTNRSSFILNLNETSFTDTIPDGLTFNRDSFKIHSVANGTDTESDPNEFGNLTYNDARKTWTFKFTHDTQVGNDPLTDYYFTYTTTMNPVPAVPTRYANSVKMATPFNATETAAATYYFIPGDISTNQEPAVLKSVTGPSSENDSSWTGTASWTITSRMSAYDITTADGANNMTLTDTLSSYDRYGKDGGADTSDDDLYYNKDSVTLTYEEEGEQKTLTEDSDYTIDWTNRAGDTNPDHATQMTIKFIGTSHTLQAMSGMITTTYTTTSSSKYAGYYGNHVVQQYFDISRTANAGFNYHPDNIPVEMVKNYSGTTYNPTNGEGSINFNLYVNNKPSDSGSDPTNRPAFDLNGEDVIVVDTLPPGMTFNRTIGITAYNRSGAQETVNSNSYTVTTQEPNSDGGTTVTWTIHPKQVQALFGQSDLYNDFAFYIQYGTTVSPDANNASSENSYKNTAEAYTVNAEEEHTHYLGSDSAEITVTNHRVFKQSGGDALGNELRYTIEANQGHLKLNKGTPLNIVDTLDSRMTLEPETLEVTNINDPKNPVLLTSEDYGFTTETIKDSDGNDATKMTISIPDEMHVQITYKVRLTGNNGSTLNNVHNNVIIQGVDDSGATTTDPSFTIRPLSASANGASGTFEIRKNDASQAAHFISDAQFGLYRVDTSSWSHNASEKIDPKDVSSSLVSVGTTNEEGLLTFDNESLASESGSQALRTSTLYYYQELSAPGNYSVDNTKHFFILQPSEGNDQSVYERELAKAQANLDDLYVPEADHGTSLVSNRPMSQVSLQASKTFDDTTGATKTMTAGQFTFLVKDASGHQVYLDSKHRPTTDAHSTVTTMNDQGQSNSVSEDNTPLTATNTANGGITFPTMFFDTAGTQTFVLSEVQGNTPGVTYDTDTHTISFEVQEEGTRYSVNPDSVTVDGSALASSNVTTEDNLTTIASGIAFGNTYAATGTAEVSAHKVLDGADLSDGQFTFGLYRGDSAEGTPIETATNDADGNITFDALSYNLSSVGNQTYTIHEQVPAGATQNDDGTYTLNGVTFDANDHTVHVAVADNGDGTLSTTVTYDEGATAAPTFTNTYAATGSTTLTAKKVLNGANLTNGQFTFALYEGESATGEPIQTATNNENGDVAFNAITYELSDVGEHTYTMKEQVPNGATRNADGTYTLNNITYDANAHTAHVVVTDNGDGTVAAVVTYDGESATAPTFTNTYTEPAAAAAPAQNQLAKTSDTMIGLSILIVALVAGGVALAAHRQRKNGRRSQH